MAIDVYDRQGNPITMEEFDALLADYDYRRVESTDVGPYWVSTIWLGLDHGFRQDGPPIIFETMVFLKEQRDDVEDRGLQDIDVVRYSTEEEARAGHDEMVLLVEAVLQEDPPQGDSEPHHGQQK